MKYFLLVFITLFGSAVVFNLVMVNTSVAASLDDPVLQRGEEVYQITCANSFCHGVNGIAASAPRLAARDFDALYIANITANGVPETPMVGFSNALSGDDFFAVLTYVARLNGIFDPQFSPDNPLAGLGIEVANPRRIPLAGDAQQGRELFFDAYEKGLKRCSTCHEVEGIGIPVAAPLRNIPGTVAALRNIETPSVKTAVFNEESIPALILSNSAAGSKLYDLSTILPVLRTLGSETELNSIDSSSWQHLDAIKSYTDQELKLVLEFLKAITL